jgi:hypothetical protein
MFSIEWGIRFLPMSVVDRMRPSDHGRTARAILHARCLVSKLSLDGYERCAARGDAREPRWHTAEFSSAPDIDPSGKCF